MSSREKLDKGSYLLLILRKRFVEIKKFCYWNGSVSPFVRDKAWLMPVIYQNTDLPGETMSYRDAVEEVLCSLPLVHGAEGWSLCSGLEGAAGAQPGSRGKQIHYVSRRDEEASSRTRVTPSTTAPAAAVLSPPDSPSACRCVAGAGRGLRK